MPSIRYFGVRVNSEGLPKKPSITASALLMLIPIPIPRTAGMYFTFVSMYAVAYGLVGTLPFIALFLWGFLYTSGMSLAQRFEWLIPREQEA